MLLCILIFNATHLRGIWIPRWSINDNQKIFEIIDDKFNHIFLQIFGNGEAYYSSKIAPVRIKDDRWLKEFIDYAHSRGIKVSAWINIFYFWGYGPRTGDLRHPINFAQDWFLLDRNGKSILRYTPDELMKMNIEGYFLAPANPSVRIYLLKIIEEIITQYDFDGVHLDYVRYPHEDFVYDIYLRTKFQRQYFYDPLFIYTDSLKMRFGLTGICDLERIWKNFINADLTEFIIQIRDKIRSLRPGCLLSAAVKPDFSSARKEFYQDWLNWVNNGYVDFVCLMAYTKDIEGIINKTLKNVKYPEKITLGLGIYNLSPEVIRNQIYMVKRTPFSGFVYFSYTQLKKNRKYLDIID
ncbi:MAG: family 10 glycosylhydrolase [candidate division WOR-3 bacterium]|nr:family 10 glycosylhydrolase [candidate division WOR-3 bacterium]